MRACLAAALSLALGVSSLAAHSGARFRSTDLSISFDDEGPGPVDCDALRVQVGGKEASVQEVLIDLPGGDVLDVSADAQGGIYVQGTREGNYTARLCKAAADPELLGAIRPVVQGHSLSVEGPDAKGWAAYLIIDAPADASMHLETANAPITLKKVRGSYVAEAQNGPISIEGASATIDASTLNGPIAVSRSEGDVKLRAQNGPLAVQLEDAWRGKGLDARTQNGPVALTVGSGFRSGIVLESTGHSPWDCDGPVCDDVRVSGRGDGRTFTLGGSPALVRLATVNGPVAIESSEQ